MTKLPIEITSQLSAARAVIERHLAGTLRAIHLFGSAVDGELRPHSDLDLMVSVTVPLEAPTRNALMRELLSVSTPPGSHRLLRPLEVTVVALDELVPWRYPARRQMQFGEWLRECVQAGVFEPAMVDHDLAILVTKARQHSACLLGPDASELFDSVPRVDLTRSFIDTIARWNVESDWHGDERNIVLAIARIWFSSCTGDFTSKDAAAAWALERLPHKHRAPLAAARTDYLNGTNGNLGNRPEQLAAFVRFCKTEIEKALRAGVR